MTRKQVLKEIDAALELRDEIYQRISKAPAGALESEWLDEQVDNIKLVEQTLDALIGQLAAPPKT